MRLFFWITLFLLTLDCWAEENTKTDFEATWVVNAQSNLLTNLTALQVFESETNNWSKQNIHLILLGNVIDPSVDLATQISQLKQIQSSAISANSKVSVIRGNVESNLLIDKSIELSSEHRAWLSSLPETLKVAKTLFSHRGLSLTAVEHDSNIKVKKELDKKIHSPSNYMGSQICHPLFESFRLSQALELVNANSLWVSNAQDGLKGQWLTRLSERLNILGNHTVAQFNYDGQVSVVDINTMNTVIASQAPDRFPANPIGYSEQEVIDILTHGKVINEVDIPVGITKPKRMTLSYQGKTMDAIFKFQDTDPNMQNNGWNRKKELADRYQYEVVAYELDKMLGIGLVPPAVERNINDKLGILQAWYTGLISKLSYSEDNIEYGGHCDRQAQRNMVRVFDLLIHNTDRNQSNIMYSRHDWQLWFIDHSRSFGTSIRRPKMYKRSKIYVTPEYKALLEQVEYEALKKLRPWLHKKQIKAIERRRKRLISDRH